MLIVADAVIPHPRARVFAAYRDQQVELIEHLPNIRKIEITSRVERGDQIDLVGEWTGGGDIPAAARSVLKESMLKWTDHATWIEGEYRTVWRTEIHAFRDAVKSSGVNRYVEVPEGTRLEMRGDFVVDTSKVPGVPRFLVKSANTTVEKLLVTQICRNALEMARGVGKLLDRQPAA